MKTRRPEAAMIGNEISKQRKMLHLSQKALADMLEMKTPQLCKLERGRNLAGEAVLARIEDCLGLDDRPLIALRRLALDAADAATGQAFAGPRLRPVGEGLTATARELRALIADITPPLDRYVDLEDQIGLPHFCPLMNLGRDTATAGDGVLLAEETRRRLGIGDAPLAGLLPILEQRNVRILFVDELPPIRDARTAERKARVAMAFHDAQYDTPVICVNRKAGSAEQLYEIAYELACCLRYRNGLAAKRPNKTAEWIFARAYAATLLMPTEALRELVDTLHVDNGQWSYPLLEDVALRFGVSYRAIVWRLASLRRIEKGLFKHLKGVRKTHPLAVREACEPPPPLPQDQWLHTLQKRAKQR